MSEEYPNSWRWNTALTIIGMIFGLTSVIVGIVVNTQIKNLQLSNENAMLLMESRISDRYANKSDLIAINDALSKLTILSVDNNTEIKLIKLQMLKQKLPTY